MEAGESTSSAAMAVEQINEAKLCTEKARKSELLASLHELLINRNKSLLSDQDIFNGCLEFEQESNVDSKKWVAGFIDAAAKADPTTIVHSNATLLRLAGESNVNVQKRVLMTVSSVLPKLLEHLQTFPGPLPPNWSKAWADMQQIKSKCINLMDSTNVGVAAQAFNCAQNFVLALSNDSIRLASISSEFLRNDASLILDRMIRKLSSPLPASSMTALINCLAQVAKLRTILIMPVVDGLTHLLDNIPVALSETQQKSIDHNLRQSLGAIQRLRIPGPWNDKIASVLSGKHRAAVKRTFSEMAPSELTDDMDTAQAAKRAKLAEDGLVSPTGIGINSLTFLASSVNPDMLALLTALPLETVMAFVLDNLAVVPLPPVAIGAAAASDADAAAAKVTDAMEVSPPESVTVEPPVPAGPPPSTLPPAPALALSSAVARCTRYISRMRGGNLASVHAAESLFLCDAVLARLAAFLPVDDPSVDLLFDYISLHLHNGTAGSSTHAKQILMFWLNREFMMAQREDSQAQRTAAASSSAADAMDVDSPASNQTSAKVRYEKLVEQVMTTLVTRIENTNKTFPSIVLEIPSLTDSVFAQLAKYCLEPQRLAMALAAIKELLLYRPPARKRCLDIVLPLTSHAMEIIRTSTIKLVASLFSNECFTTPIIEHALELLESVCIANPDEETRAANEAAAAAAIKAEDMDAIVGIVSENKPEEPQAPAADGQRSGQQLSEDEIRRRVLLFFALCSKKHEMLHDIVDVYVRCNSANVRKVIHREAPPLIRAIGQNSPAITAVVQGFPRGAETFILQILHVLTESSLPTPQLVDLGVKAFKEYDDARFLIPVISGLSTPDAIAFLPRLIVLPTTLVKTQVFQKLLHVKPSPLTPSELMVQLHVVDLKRHDISLKKLIEIIQLLFEDTRAVVKQDVMAAVLQQLSDINPLPMLFMRTVIQTVARIKTMGNFVIGILSRLIMKQIWNDSRLWEGFVTCLKIMMPQSITVLLQLPAAQFEQVLRKNNDIRDKLVAAQSKGLVMIPKNLHQILASIAPPAPAPAAPADAPYNPEQEDANGAAAPIQSVSV